MDSTTAGRAGLADDQTPRSLVRRYYPALDGLRGVAILMVFLIHYGRYFANAKIFAVLWPGVDLFFALSGFLITGILYDSRADPRYFRNFYIRRALRIFPLYYGFFLLVAVLTPVLRLHYSDAMWSHLFYAANLFVWHIGTHDPTWIYFGPFRGRESGLWLGPLWSLCVEEQFYLLWPLLMWMLPSRRAMMWFCGVAVLAMMCARTAIFLLYPAAVLQTGHLAFMTYTRSDAMLLGAWLALGLRGVQLSRAQVRKIAYPTIALCTLAIAAGYVWTGWRGHVELDSNPVAFTYGYTLVGLIAICVLLLALEESSTVHRVLRNKWLAALGVVSYGFYFFHGLFAALMSSANVRFFEPRHLSFVLVVLYFGAVYVVAWLSFRYFESPFIKLKDRFAPGHRSVPSGREDVSPMALMED